MPHEKDGDVKTWLRSHEGCIRVLWFPKGCPEPDPMEECWRQMKDSVVACTIYPTFTEMKKTLAGYLRTKRFKLNLIKYLCR
jgi:hypothetical protein